MSTSSQFLVLPGSKSQVRSQKRIRNLKEVIAKKIKITYAINNELSTTNPNNKIVKKLEEEEELLKRTIPKLKRTLTRIKMVTTNPNTKKTNPNQQLVTKSLNRTTVKKKTTLGRSRSPNRRTAKMELVKMEGSEGSAVQRPIGSLPMVVRERLLFGNLEKYGLRGASHYGKKDLNLRKRWDDHYA